MTRQQLKGLNLCTSTVALNKLNYGHKAQTGGKNRSMEAKNSKAKQASIEQSASAWAYKCVVENAVPAEQNRKDTLSYVNYMRQYALACRTRTSMVCR